MVVVVLVAGALLGLALGTVGGGGAVLAVPVLVYLLDQPVHAATTASLLVVAAAAATGAVGHARQHAVCWRLALAFAAAAVPGTAAGTLANRAAGADVLLAGFALLLLAVAALTWRRSTAAGVAAGECPHLRLGVVAIAGLATGALTGLLGVGGGFAVVPALALGLSVPMRRAIATSLVIVTAVSLTGLAGHLAAGASADWSVAVPFAAAGMATAALGAVLARRLRVRTLSRAFAVLLGGVAVSMLASVALLGGPPAG
jgi:uncharacterized membrane protein YfcA